MLRFLYCAPIRPFIWKKSGIAFFGAGKRVLLAGRTVDFMIKFYEKS